MDPISLDEGVSVDVQTLTQLFSVITNGTLPNSDNIEVLRVSELLPGWYEDWVLFDQERLKIQRLSALETMARLYLENGNLGCALDAAMAAASIEPFRESARLMMIQAHLAQGNFSSALHVYEKFSRELQRELGVEPSPRFREALRMHPAQAIQGQPRRMQP